MARSPAKNSGGSKKGRGGSSTQQRQNDGDEIQQSKSPAEFFAENQAIAGFDNMGKSLYTTVRELIENSLDACESVNVLPDIQLNIEEMTQRQFNELRGVNVNKKLAKKDVKADTTNLQPPPDDSSLGTNATTASQGQKSGSNTPKKATKKSTEAYFLISVRDNGCGMAHDAIPNLLGRVLSGSKYGVRQTRGKFGLGAKMALIWSKKSTGVPIKIKTSHLAVSDRKRSQESGGEGDRIGRDISTCVLDIDIYKNRPRVLEHTKVPNKEKWVGTLFEVLIAGNWTTYKSRIVQYLQQLAIITPYAKLEMRYSNRSDAKKDMTIRYDRRSEQMPPPAREVKHHPSSVNNLLVQQLLEKSNCKTILKFLSSDLSSVSPALAKRIIDELGDDFDESMPPDDVNDKQITRLVQLLRGSDQFKSPDGSCLSPLGEYNLNLGIRKVIEPEVVATARDRPGAYEGHPFIVEAAVSLGGKDAKEGITVVRFANRIPLLFEAGADVATRVAQSKIKWSSYKIDHKRDKIGVFVSIVSTKVPFKGTGKEYIGDDITEIQVSVKRALQSCCQQLRAHLTKRNALRDQRERRSRLVKYVPDVSRSIFGILDTMRKRKLEEADAGSKSPSPKKKRARSSQKILITPDDSVDNETAGVLEKLEKDEITEKIIENHLIDAIESHAMADGQGATGVGADSSMRKGRSGDGSLNNASVDVVQPLFLLPVYQLLDNSDDLHHPLFTFRPLKSLSL